MDHDCDNNLSTPDLTRYRDVPVVVLGASGFIGRWVARNLSAQGAAVHLVVRDRTVAEQVFAAYDVRGAVIEADLLDAKSLRNLFFDLRPSITFNLAGYGVDRAERDARMSARINHELVQTVCETLVQVRDPDWTGQDLIHTGSALEYGAVGGDLRENTAPNPTTDYGQTKLAGTRAVTDAGERGLKCLTARLFTVYGPGEHPGRLLPSLLEATLADHQLPLTTGDQKRDFTFVEDVAEGLLRLGLSTPPAGHVVNLATGKLATVRHFIDVAARILQIAESRLDFGAIPTRPEEMEHSEISVARLRDLLGWTPQTQIATGIQQTQQFIRRTSPST